jgi:hypothetical protein
VSTTEELLGKKKRSGSSPENREYDHRDVTLTTRHPLSANSWHEIRRKAAVAYNSLCPKNNRNSTLLSSLLLFILTADGFLPGGIGATITHITQN